MAKDKSAKSSKKDKDGKKGKKGKKARDNQARFAGALVGLVFLVPTALDMVRGSLDLSGALPHAGLAIAVALLVEWIVVPLGRFIIGYDPRKSRRP